MFGFGKKKPLTREDFDGAAADVQERIAAGDYVGAAQAASALRKATEANNGPNTVLCAEARMLEARAALTLGDHDRARELMCAACEIEGDDDVTKVRLDNQMHYGDLLSELGELDEAEVVHRAALDERRRVYGKEAPEFGYGAESLGTLELRRGNFEQAADLARLAAFAFRAGEANKLDAALILWMLAEKSRDPERNVLDTLDAGDRQRVLDAVARTPAYLFVDATIDLRWEVYEALTDEEQKLACLKSIASHSDALGRTEDHDRAMHLVGSTSVGSTSVGSTSVGSS